MRGDDWKGPPRQFWGEGTALADMCLHLSEVLSTAGGRQTVTNERNHREVSHGHARREHRLLEKRLGGAGDREPTGALGCTENGLLRKSSGAYAEHRGDTW